MNHEKRRCKKTGGLRNVDMEKNEENHLDRTYCNEEVLIMEKIAILLLISLWHLALVIILLLR